jgi:ABC-type glycerol-3-phosphate transport system permease component
MPFDRFYLNSLFVAGSVTILQLFTSSLAAFAFARLRFKGRNLLFTLYLATLMIPFPVLLIPNFLIARQLGWYDTYQALILPPAFSAFSTFLLRQHYMNVPYDLDDAARMDGATSFRIWWNIILPITKTTLAALAIFIFLGTWNDFLWPLVITNSQAMRTVPIGLNSVVHSGYRAYRDWWALAKWHDHFRVNRHLNDLAQRRQACEISRDLELKLCAAFMLDRQAVRITQVDTVLNLACTGWQRCFGCRQSHPQRVQQDRR